MSATLIGIILSTNVTVTAGVEIPTAHAFQLIFILGAAVSLAGVVLAAFIPRRERRYEDMASIPIQRG